jgi:hypothetical protein
MGERDVLPIQFGNTDVHRHQAIARIAADQKSAFAVEPDFGPSALIHQQPADAARGVAAGFHFAAIRIEKPQHRVGAFVPRRDQHQRVAANAEMTVGNGARPGRRHRDGLFARIEHDEIVAQALHFAKRDHGAPYRGHGPLLPLPGEGEIAKLPVQSREPPCLCA